MASREGSKERREDRTYMLRCWFTSGKDTLSTFTADEDNANNGKDKKNKKDKKDKKSESETVPMSTMLAISPKDTSEDVIARLHDQLTRRGLIRSDVGIAGEVKPKHLRVCIIMETYDNNVYAIPNTVAVSKTIRKSLMDAPPSPQPLVGSCVILSAKQLKKDNADFEDDDASSRPLVMPPNITAFLSAAFPIRAKPCDSQRIFINTEDGSTSRIVDFNEASNPSTPRGGGGGGGGDGVPPAAMPPPPTAPTLALPPSSKKLPPKMPHPAVMTEQGGAPSGNDNGGVTDASSSLSPTRVGGSSNNGGTNTNATANNSDIAGAPKGFVTISVSNAQAVDCVASVTLKVNAHNQRLLDEYRLLVREMLGDPSDDANDNANANKKDKHDNHADTEDFITVNVVYYRHDTAFSIIQAALAKMRCVVNGHLEGLQEAAAAAKGDMKRESEGEGGGGGGGTNPHDVSLGQLSSTSSIFSREVEEDLAVFKRLLHYLGRLNANAMLLCVPNNNSNSNSSTTGATAESQQQQSQPQGRLLTFSPEDTVPALPSDSKADPTIKMELVDLGPNFIPKSNNNNDFILPSSSSGGGVSASAVASYTDRLAQQQKGVNDLPLVNYAHKNAALQKLSDQIEFLLRENEALEKENGLAEETNKALEAEAEKLMEQYHSARTAYQDVQRLTNLKAWFQSTLEDKAKANTELQQRILLGDDYDEVMAVHRIGSPSPNEGVYEGAVGVGASSSSPVRGRADRYF